MKDLVALQMTRRQPVLSYDSGKPKTPAQVNRQVRLQLLPADDVNSLGFLTSDNGD